MHRRAGQRPAGAAGDARWTTATSSRSSPPRPRAPARRRDWLGFVQSARARSKIRQWFTKERREEAIEQGKDAHRRGRCASRGCRCSGCCPASAVLAHRPRAALRRRHRRCTRRSARARSRRATVVQRLVHSARRRGGRDRGPRRDGHPEPDRRAGPAAARATPASSSPARRTCWIKLAKCCTPVPGDEIIGFVTRGGGVSVHRDRLHQRRPRCERRPSGSSTVEWAPSARSVFLVADPGRGARPARGCSPT